MQFRSKSRFTFIVWLVGAACLLAIATARGPSQNWLSTDFQSLLPDDQKNHWIPIANEHATHAYNGQLVWLIEGGDRERVALFSTALMQQLESAGYADPKFGEEQAQRWQYLSDTLLRHHRGLITVADYQLLHRDPAAYFEQSRQQLYSPLGGISLNLLESDATGLFANYLSNIMPAQPRRSGSTDDLFSELLISHTPPEKLGLTELPALYKLYQTLQAQAKQQQLVLYATGAPLYTAYGVESAQREVSTIGAASLTVLITLLLLSLRSISAVILTLTCTAAGVCGGLILTVALLQEIHILTLVFGVSLIGISADYALHYLAHSRSTDWAPALGLNKIYGSLRLSMLSSVLAFSTLLLLPFPGIRQIGLFMGSGLVCSFLTVCLLFPHFYRGKKKPVPLSGFWVKPQWLWRHAGPILMVLILVSMAALTQLPANDDVRGFYASPPALASGQDRIVKELPHAPDTRYLLLEASSQSELLRLEERLARDLGVLQLNQALGEVAGIGTLIPAPETQLKNATLLISPAVTAQLTHHMALLGLPDELQAQQLNALQQAFKPLTIEALNMASLPVGLGGFLGCDETGCASRIRLAGIRDATELQSLANRYPEVYLIDQIADINASMGVYRDAVSFLLLTATLLIAAFLSVFYGWRTAAAILATPLATCLLSLLVVGYWQGGYNLINLMALLLLIGVSLDYAIFRTFTPAGEQAATTLAIALSAATSILAFGMLSFSDTPVIRSFGQTIGVGLILAWLFSWLRLSPQVQK